MKTGKARRRLSLTCAAILGLLLAVFVVAQARPGLFEAQVAGIPLYVAALVLVSLALWGLTGAYMALAARLDHIDAESGD